jgi:hypothetical protein
MAGQYKLCTYVTHTNVHDIRMAGVSKPSLVVHLYGTIRIVGHWPICSSIKFSSVVVCGAEALMHLWTLSHNTIQNVEEMENKT